MYILQTQEFKTKNKEVCRWKISGDQWLALGNDSNLGYEGVHSVHFLFAYTVHALKKPKRLNHPLTFSRSSTYKSKANSDALQHSPITIAAKAQMMKNAKMVKSITYLHTEEERAGGASASGHLLCCCFISLLFYRNLNLWDLEHK